MEIKRYSFSNLAQEIQDTILSFVTPSWSHSDLHNFRLVNHAFKAAITPVLFHTLHLSRNRLSGERLTQISKSPELARYVHSISLDRREWRLHDLSYSSFCKILRKDLQNSQANISSNGAQEDKDILDSIPHEQLQAWHWAVVEEYRAGDEVAGYAGDSGTHWLDHISGVFRQFPNLEAMELITYEEAARNTHYSQRRTGLTGMNDMYFGNFGTGNILNWAAADSEMKLRSLSLSHIRPPDYALLDPYTKALRTLEAFRFCLDSPYVTIGGLHKPRASSIYLMCLLRVCTDLKTLVLEFCSLKERTIKVEQCQEKISRALVQHRMPNLQKLELVNLEMDPEALLEFLEAHKQTLKSLRLCNWRVPVAGDGLGVIPQAFWKMTKVTNLTSVVLEGYFGVWRDNNIVGWQAVRGSSVKDGLWRSEGVLTRLEGFLCHKGPFPFSDEADKILDHQQAGGCSTDFLADTGGRYIDEDATWKSRAA